MCSCTQYHQSIPSHRPFGVSLKIACRKFAGGSNWSRSGTNTSLRDYEKQFSKAINTRPESGSSTGGCHSLTVLQLISVSLQFSQLTASPIRSEAAHALTELCTAALRLSKKECASRCCYLYAVARICETLVVCSPRYAVRL